MSKILILLNVYAIEHKLFKWKQISVSYFIVR